MQHMFADGFNSGMSQFTVSTANVPVVLFTITMQTVFISLRFLFPLDLTYVHRKRVANMGHHLEWAVGCLDR